MISSAIIILIILVVILVIAILYLVSNRNQVDNRPTIKRQAKQQNYLSENFGEISPKILDIRNSSLNDNISRVMVNPTYNIPTRRKKRSVKSFIIPLSPPLDKLKKDEEIVKVKQVTPKEEKLNIRVNNFTSKGEAMCKQVLEEIYPGHLFYTIRPNWLRNPASGRNLEIDCYNKELCIGVEYNGQQHYDFPNGWHKSHEEFKKVLIHDEYKKKVCKAKGVILVSVPYTLKEYSEIKDHIINEINKQLNERNSPSNRLE